MSHETALRGTLGPQDGGAPIVQSVVLLALLVPIAALIILVGHWAESRAIGLETSWARERRMRAINGCGVCGQPACYDVARLMRRQGRVVGRVEIGLRCRQHREAESIAVESGQKSARVLTGLGWLVLLIAVGSTCWAVWTRSSNPLWPAAKLRPARILSLSVSIATWVLIGIGILAFGFREAYLTLPLWMAVGGTLCFWLYELLSGGEFIHCSVCSFRGNLDDLRYFRGECPACGSRVFKAQELLGARRSMTKTVYRFKMMVGLSLEELEKLEKSSRLWRDPRGAWNAPEQKLKAA